MSKYYSNNNMNLKKSESYNFTPSKIAKSTFFYLQSIGHFWTDKKYFTSREGYDSFLLIYTVKGKGYAKYRNKDYILNKDDVLLLDCNDFQEYYTDKEDLWEIEYIHFNGSTTRKYFNLIYDKNNSYVKYSHYSSISTYINDLFYLIENNKVQMEIQASNIILKILTKLVLASSENTQIYSSLSNNIIKSNELKNDNLKYLNSKKNIYGAIKFIENNYSKDISIYDMSKAAFYSNYHFSRLFKKVIGYSPYEYLIKYRINIAKELLKSSEMSIDEITNDIGFLSTSNFIKTFKSLEKITPLKYRKYWNS